ncbi:GNAT family N-acetyltransferase [Microbulbifer litoralis]|uniref:GNAT family N-acetyltransferase n=1 Tax=Microbulbifer litoralis TaxID=2933965 RepID=UPI002028D5DE|nr:GNAT family N-acetyltransferase [Microbulbifer sp. GX H0434]
MIFQTNRLIVRRLALEDADSLSEIFSDPQVMHFSVRGVLDKNGIEQHIDENVQEYGKSHFCRWAIIERLSSKLIGVCGLSKDTVDLSDIVHLNYRFSKNNWGRGFATEVVSALVEHSASIGLNRIHALIEPANLASVRVVEKAGFKVQGAIIYKGAHAHVFSRCTKA